MRIRLLVIAISVALPAFPVGAETIHIVADRDATLIESPNGELANGAGPALFAGRTGQTNFAVRRALIRFDVAAALPREARIERVFVSLYNTPGNDAAHTLGLHQVLQDWSEGPAT